MAHTLVTGGAGFIGSHLVDRLLAEPGARVTVVDNFDPFYARALKEGNISSHRGDAAFRSVEGDMLDDLVLEQVLGPAAPPVDTIVHIAAKAGVRPSIADPLGYHRVNVTGTLKLLEAARKAGVPHFVLASSSSVYGENPHVPWKESERGLVPISPYAATKLAAEQFARVYADLHGMKVTTLRFFTVYGPRQRPDLAIHQFFRNISTGRPILQFGDGGTRRDYTFIDDIINGVRGAMARTKGERHEVYNLGNSATIDLRSLIQAIEDVMGRKAIIERRPEQPGDVPRTFADVTKAREHLGYVPATSIHEGLRHFHAWFAGSQAMAN